MADDVQGNLADSTTPVHDWFGLTYGNYLVLHRTLLQSMPVAWQRRFIGTIEELEASFRHIEHPPGFKVETARDAHVNDLKPHEMVELGITYEVENEDDEGFGGDLVYRDKDGRQLDGGEHVMVPCPDPIPHYRQGRVRVEPRQNEPESISAKAG